MRNAAVDGGHWHCPCFAVQKHTGNILDALRPSALHNTFPMWTMVHRDAASLIFAPSAATYQPLRWYSSIRMSTGQCLVWPTTFPAASSVQNSYCLMIVDIVDIVDCIIIIIIIIIYIMLVLTSSMKCHSQDSYCLVIYIYISISSLSSSNWESPILADDF